MFIGIFGKTGTGKSSLINALLNEKTLLPTSSRKACTSCIIQVQVHENNRLVYKAEIEFISKEEWEEELKELIENCKQDHNEDSSYTEDGQEAESELAKEKNMAVYGKDGLNKSFFELANVKILDTLKGSKVFFSKTGSELSEKINQYIRSESDDETSRSYWPLVKVVKLHVPKACGLPDQVVLVDIPGTGDSNKDRNKMWKEYISKCNSIWIVTDITRAESDRNALEILNTELRGIAGGGECQNITYICTKTDEIGIQMGIQSGHKTQGISGHAEPDDDSKLKRETILKRNTKVKEKINDKCKKIVKKFLFGLEDNSATNPIKVFTVSSKEFWNTKEGKNNVLTDEETELPSLKKHVKELYVNQTKKAVEHYVSEVSVIISFLHVPKENAEEKGRTNLGGYHKTIKALSHNSGSFRSSKGDVIDLNNELASPIYAVVDNTLKSSFQLNQSTRRSIKAALELLQLKFENDAIFTKKKAGQSYRLVFIKTELRRVLVLLEKKILQSKKIIYNSIVQSIQDGMDPVYKEASKEKGRNFMSKIHTMFEDKIKQSRNCLFKEAMKNMLNEFTKLKDEVRETLQQKMDASMKLALTQFPEGVHFPDSTDELKEMKNLCDLLSLNIFN